MSDLAIDLAERGWIPDSWTRFGIRRLLRSRLDAERERHAREGGILPKLRVGPLALSTKEANEQHYEVPPRFFELVLGKRLKYSSCYWPAGVETLDAAEEAMLELTCERAQIEDGMSILDLGCGWGSLSLWIAEHYPNCQIVSVSNSAPQREHIEATARTARFDNLVVHTCDMNDFDPERRFDRVVSIEMFEHMRNYELLLDRIGTWLEPAGRLFVHIFCHRKLAYLFQVDGEQDWMARYFFTDGLMPSRELLSQFDRSLEVEQSWSVDGTHYEKTSEAWLEQLDSQREIVESVFRTVYDDPERWIERWRLFFLACAELFGYRGGQEWFVGHYLLRHSGNASATEGSS